MSTVLADQLIGEPRTLVSAFGPKAGRAEDADTVYRDDLYAATRKTVGLCTDLPSLRVLEQQLCRIGLVPENLPGGGMRV